MPQSRALPMASNLCTTALFAILFKLGATLSKTVLEP